MTSDNIDRIFKWDNAKAILIILVVSGHAIHDLIKVSDLYKSLYFFIYLFHMPLFMFLSGMFSRRAIETGRHLRQRIVGYLLLGFFLKYMILACRLIFDKYPSQKFYMLRETTVPWYLMALSVYLLVTFLTKEASRRFLLAFAILTACMTGYDKTIGSYLILSRLFTYYPFFLLGTLWQPDRIPKFSSGLLQKGIAAVLLAALLLFTILHADLLYPYIDLIKGGNPYAKIDGISAARLKYGFLYRLFYYAAAIFVSACVLTVVPKGRSFLTRIGQTTLSVYMFHRPVQFILLYAGYQKAMLAPENIQLRIIYLLFSFLLVLILSLPVFKRLEAAFWNLLHRL